MRHRRESGRVISLINQLQPGINVNEENQPVRGNLLLSLRRVNIQRIRPVVDRAGIFSPSCTQNSIRLRDPILPFIFRVISLNRLENG